MTPAPSIFDLIGAIASVITALAIVLAVFQLLGTRQQGHRDFENIYVQRYWAISDRFSKDITIHGAGSKFKGDDIAAAFAYMQLCEDEVDMRRLGRVTNSTWKFWSSAIRFEASNLAYTAILEENPDRFNGVRRLVSTGADPSTKNWIWGKMNGL